MHSNIIDSLKYIGSLQSANLHEHDPIDNKEILQINLKTIDSGSNSDSSQILKLDDIEHHIKTSTKIQFLTVCSISSFVHNGENLRRIYIKLFNDAEEMAAYQTALEKSRQSSHQYIGTSQKLFFFSDYSPGSVFFTPKGTRMINKLYEIMRKLYYTNDFHEVITPNIFKADLFKISGHYQKYKSNMFCFHNNDSDESATEYCIKPMNCPGHCLLYRSQTRSYKDLPLRLADFGVLHRNECSGALSGLTRVRKFCQDDAHIFCTMDQIDQELRNCLQLLDKIYSLFGFNYYVELSTRPDQYLGEISIWDKAEYILKNILDEIFMNNYKLNIGDGAFYGPKIDIHILDRFNRSHQCATIQLDFIMPSNFKLEYITPDNNTRTPVMIHRAIYGSLERFFALLIENYAGTYPMWLSPNQVVVIPVNSQHIDYANSIHKKITDAGFFCDIDISPNTLGKKIANAKNLENRYNYIIVIGDKEVLSSTINVRDRSNTQQTITIDDFLLKIDIEHSLLK